MVALKNLTKEQQEMVVLWTPIVAKEAEEQNSKFMELWKLLIQELPDNADGWQITDESVAITALEESDCLTSELVKVLRDSGFWAINGDMVLCPTEEQALALCRFLNDAIEILEENQYSILTGYFDPEEDDRNDEQDACTGFHYVQVE